jgi:DNA (cytosine-5)-methyltransferase 1
MIALDLFAGTGWGVACQRLGIVEHGAEVMPEAIETRGANGMLTPYGDVALLPNAVARNYDLLIASPPCQTFSQAGKGLGRAALDTVLAAVTVVARGEAHDRSKGDPRTWLVLDPLRITLGSMPTYLAWEQVSPVLPVWEACAGVLRSVGYSVWTGMLHSEQYGVPQTRRRAFLIASLDGPVVAPPEPTHSRYYPRSPGRLDPGVRSWVSMAEGLGWGATERPSMTVTGGGTDTGGAEPFGSGARRRLEREQVAGRWLSHQAEWVFNRPSATIVGTFRPDIVAAPGWRKSGDGPRQNAAGSVRVTVEEAAALQSYPAGFVFCGKTGKQYLQVGNAVPPLLAEAVLRTLVVGRT